ncbi:lipase-like protein [Dermatophagoides farinae]|uniref:Lipase-like protein n=1 Tax=Dermatophagoides farinae TaxID=6954 RepID=A0A9D4NYG3_DERFA|nr:pancreatic triacylglycerol lipase-like [Dermatophagoides farinae]KAH7640547.1 lipase-like protein [Dermatophagoides farinae]
MKITTILSFCFVLPILMANGSGFGDLLKNNHLLKNLPINQGEICYENFGCYNASEIGSEWPITKLMSFYPEPPEKQNITFYVFSCKNRYNPSILSYNVNEDEMKNLNYDRNLRTIFIIHGFTDFYDQFNWMGNLKDGILTMEPCRFNVITVDWRGGSIVQNYLKAVANTRLVGFVVASMIKKLNKVYETTNDHFTVIGHSLGGQISGFVGKNLQTHEKLRLIIGLDPAGPAFSNVSEKSCLNPNDAQLVISIHTNGGKNIANGFGILKPSGHYSFYPNGGENQNGCEPVRGVLNILLHGIRIGLTDTFACSHRRAYLLFSNFESKYDDFQSIAYRCNNHNDFLAGKCGECNELDDCKRWGGWFDYWQEQKLSETWTEPIKYFVETRDIEPYSYFHYQIMIKTANGFESVNATLTMNITGSLRSDYSPKATIEAIFEPNKIYTHLFLVEKTIGMIQSINMKISYDDDDESETESEESAFIIVDNIKVNYMNGYSESQRQQLSSQLAPMTEKDSKMFVNTLEASRFRLVDN